jgi:hypothetical protein
MNAKRFVAGLGIALIIIMVLEACVPAATPTPAPPTAAPATQSPATHTPSKPLVIGIAQSVMNLDCFDLD